MQSCQSFKDDKCFFASGVFFVCTGKSESLFIELSILLLNIQYMIDEFNYGVPGQNGIWVKF